MPTTEEVKRLQKKFNFNQNEVLSYHQNSAYFHASENGFQSSFFNPYTSVFNSYGNLKTADSRFSRNVPPLTLRRVSQKAWIINLCISHVQKKIRPFLKPSTNRNLRGFVIKKKGEDVISAAGRAFKERKRIEDFLLNTGFESDSDRDGFGKYCIKIIRDALEIDQIATEIGYTESGEPYAFWAVDAATIEKVLPGQSNPFNIKFVQVIDHIPQAYYPEDTLVFDYQNPRTDIYHSFYGYSYVEQAIDLITSSINAFTYNSGFFTENKLPKGMLLIDGDASQETVEQMEDYISDIMSGSVSNQWRIPIIPASTGGSGEANSIRFVNLAGTNREMEFQQWLDFLVSGVVALFGCSMEELGLHSSHSQALFERNTAPQIEASKSLILGDMLMFLQAYLNRIIEKFFSDYELEFVGYERDDPKAVLEFDKEEVSTFKTLNEKRKEKGLEPLKMKWADECPANPQFVQMYQAESGAGVEDAGDFGESEEEGAPDDEETQENEGEEKLKADEEAWENLEDGEEGVENGEEDGGGEEASEDEETRKSLVFYF